jgi:hypothetical protein
MVREIGLIVSVGGITCNNRINTAPTAIALTANRGRSARRRLTWGDCME